MITVTAGDVIAFILGTILGFFFPALIELIILTLM